MNKFLLLFSGIFVLTSGMLFAQTDKHVDSKIKEVVVFLNRAQVKRIAQVRIDPGNSNIIIQGLTPQLDPQSIQVAGKGKFTILGVSHRKNFLSEFNMPPAMKLLKDSITHYSDQIKTEQNLKDITQKEEQLILNNQKINGSDRNLTVAELKAMADFFRVRLAELGLQRIRHDKQLARLQERITKLELQLREQHTLMARGTSDVVVSVMSEAGGSVALEVDYIVANAGWVPLYDVRASGNMKPIQLGYKARVQQRTGEDWRDVRLTLSTGNPSLGGNKPELHPWYIDFPQPVVMAPKYRKEALPAMMEGSVAGVAASDADYDSVSLSRYTEVVETTLTTEFAISLPYTVLSSGVPATVDVAIHELPAQYTYYVVPGLDTDVFLVAQLVGWRELSLLPGQANVFMEGNFVAKTNIDPVETGDTLAISLGRDKRVVVKREKVKDLTSQRIIGSNKKESFAFAVDIRNGSGATVNVVVQDQVPVSRNNQIEVTVSDHGGGRIVSHSGLLEWKISLAAGEQRKIQYQYEVKYPKDRFISGL